MSTLQLTLPEIVDWCIYGLTKGNPDAVLPLLIDLQQALQELEDNVCPLCGTKHVELNRFSGIKINDDFEV